ncbi:MAG: hypothetical protein K6E72_05750 [Saccharofermentans sp.]|jgi:hypothetical protein|nr:hypothetical protein [Lachnospiraceae bacterium]MCR5384117.1 hypothetical protein [Saccharofermentans sp.]
MLQDSFVETSVKRKNGFTEVIFNTFLITTAIIAIVFSFLMPIFVGENLYFISGILSFAIVAGVVILIKRQHKEYEVEISNDLVDCAIILGDNKRDELISFSIKDCEYIGPVTSDRYKSDKENAGIVIKMTDYKEFDIDEKYWYWLVPTEGIKVMIVFMYKEEMYPVFRRYNPRGTIAMAMPKKAKEKDPEDD